MVITQHARTDENGFRVLCVCLDLIAPKTGPTTAVAAAVVLKSRTSLRNGGARVASRKSDCNGR